MAKVAKTALKFILTFGLASVSMSNANAKTVDSIQLNPDRTLFIQGEVNDSLYSVARHLLYLSEITKSASKGDLNPDNSIWLVLNTPGGSLYPTIELIDTMKTVQAKGIKIKCLVTNSAMSAGYYIYSQCSERYALPYSTLMFHFVRTGAPSPISEIDLTNLLAQHKQINEALLKMIKGINFTSDQIATLFYLEMEWSAKAYVENYDKDLGYIIIANKVLGLPVEALEFGMPRRMDSDSK